MVITQFLLIQQKYFLPRGEMAERGEIKFGENCHENNQLIRDFNSLKPIYISTSYLIKKYCPHATYLFKVYINNSSCLRLLDKRLFISGICAVIYIIMLNKFDFIMTALLCKAT